MSKKKLVNVPLKEQIKPIFKERIIQMLGSKDEYLKLEETILLPQRKSFRINSIKCTDEEGLIKRINEKGIKTLRVPWSKHSYFVIFDKESRSDLGNLFEHFLGEIYVQEATSMCPPELLEIPDEILDDFSVLDMAAAPGSKTTQVGNLMKNKGVLVANEIDFKRLGPLKINLEKSGLRNVVIINHDGRRIEGGERFDRVLLDAPCSGSGVIRKSPNTIKRYNPKKLKGIVNLQLQLMQRAFELLKKGGIMTYSTCSMDVEENEFAVMEFMKRNKEVVLLKCELLGLVLNNRVKEFEGIKIPKEVYENTIRIWPQDNDTNGFFVAKFQKLE